MKKTIATLLFAVTCAASANAGATFVAGNYNIRYRTLVDKTDDPATNKYWDARCDNVAQTIRDGGFDILSINEMTDDPRYDGRTMFADMQKFFPEPKYKFVTKLGHNYNKHAIMYDATKFEVLDEGSFWLGPDPDNYHSDVWDHGNFGRMSLWAKFRVKESGEIFFYMSTHLHHQGNISKNEGAAQNVDFMRKIAGPYPVFICGDHNCTTTREPFYKLYSSYFDDSRSIAAKTDGSDGTCNVWNGSSLKRLDYVWVRGVKVNDYSTIQNKYDKDFYPSDHFPVRVEVTLENPVDNYELYVDSEASESGDGSKTNPFRNLQDALDKASRGATIYVAEGTYKPTFHPTGNKNLTMTFNIEKSVALLGGYDRNFENVVGRSVLSGDLNDDEVANSGDATAVVTIAATASVHMCDLEITGGYGKGLRSGGIHCYGPRLMLDNVYLHDNKSSLQGAGIYAYGQIKAENCIFENNVTPSNGGAVFTDTNGSSMPWSHTFSHCRFNSNEAMSGAAIYVSNTMWLAVTGCSFYYNKTTARGALTVTGNKASSTVSVTNCTFANNLLKCANTSANDKKGGAAIYIQDMRDTSTADEPKARIALANNTIVGNTCEYVAGQTVPDDFNAAAVNVLKNVDVYLNNNIIVGNYSPKNVCDVYLTVPEAIVGSNSKYNLISSKTGVNYTLQSSDKYAADKTEANSLLASSLDGELKDGRFVANLSEDGPTPVVKIINPMFGTIALNSLKVTRFNEGNTYSDFNGNLQIVKGEMCTFDQRGATRDTEGGASYGAYEYGKSSPSSVMEVTQEDTEAPVLYYDLRGIRVNPENLVPGIYIRRQGSKATKILIKT